MLTKNPVYVPERPLDTESSLYEWDFPEKVISTLTHTHAQPSNDPLLLSHSATTK